MAYNTKNIIRDAAGAPVPQVYNPTADAYEVLQGRNGANRVELYGPDGNPIGTTSGKLNVRASEIEALAGALTDAAVTDPAASANIIALLKGLLKQLQGTGGGAAPVQLTGSIPAGTNEIGKVTPANQGFVLLSTRNNLSITTSNKFVGTSSGGTTGFGYPLDTRNYNELALFFQNTSDVGVTIHDVYYFDDLTKTDIADSITLFPLTLAVAAGAKAFVYYDGTNYYRLKYPLAGFVFYFSGAGTPTYGALNFKLYGRQ